MKTLLAWLGAIAILGVIAWGLLTTFGTAITLAAVVGFMVGVAVTLALIVVATQP